MKLLSHNWKDIEDIIWSRLNISNEQEKMLKEEGIEIIIPHPYLRAIPPGRDEIFANTQEHIKDMSKESKQKKLKIFK